MGLNKLAVFISLAAGVVAGVLDILLYNSLVGVWGRPILIALMFAIFAVFVCAALFITVTLQGESDEEFWFLDGNGMIVIGLVVALLVAFGLGMLLEFIYDRDVSVADTPGSYVFLLDESGSMEGNDANLERYAAVNYLMETMPDQFPYAVYMFADETVCAREMAPVSQGSFQADTNLANNIGAGTMLRDGLQTILDDINSGVLSKGSNDLRVIVLTDGFASDMGALFGSKDIIKAYKDADITVSAVGLGNVDGRLLNNLTSKTNGTYVHIENAQELSGGFMAVGATDAGRDLLSARNLSQLNGLYAVLRILFLTVLGAFIALMKAMACAKSDDTVKILVVGAVAALIGAVLVELFAALAFASWIGQILYFALLAITPVTMQYRCHNFSNIPIYQ